MAGVVGDPEGVVVEEEAGVAGVAAGGEFQDAAPGAYFVQLKSHSREGISRGAVPPSRWDQISPGPGKEDFVRGPLG